MWLVFIVYEQIVIWPFFLSVACIFTSYFRPHSLPVCVCVCVLCVFVTISFPLSPSRLFYYFISFAIWLLSNWLRYFHRTADNHLIFYLYFVLAIFRRLSFHLSGFYSLCLLIPFAFVIPLAVALSLSLTLCRPLCVSVRMPFLFYLRFRLCFRFRLQWSERR